MFIIGNALTAVVVILDNLLLIYSFVLFAAVVLSWVQAHPSNPIVRIIHTLTQPAIQAVRQKIPTVFGGMDFAPLIVLLLISFIRLGVIPSLLTITTGWQG